MNGDSVLSSKSVTECRRRRKSDLVRVLGGKCIICGFDGFIEALEFHHLDPTKKDFGIAALGSTRN